MMRLGPVNIKSIAGRFQVEKLLQLDQSLFIIDISHFLPVNKPMFSIQHLQFSDIIKLFQVAYPDHLTGMIKQRHTACCRIERLFGFLMDGQCCTDNFFKRIISVQNQKQIYGFHGAAHVVIIS
ncbi:hypothetical protein DSECCO2_560010 [anaerobic digester metagenome]